MATLRLVVFDCDGVLVDSEPLANRIFAETLQAHGFAMSYDECVRDLVGLSLGSCFELLRARFGRPLPVGFAALLQDRTHAAFARHLQPVPGIAEALDAIEADGFVTCVASSGEVAKMRVSLGRTGLWERFEGRIFSAASVPRGKPFPDLFLHAAAQLGVAPGSACVIEDSPYGVRAARAAGMRAFGYVGGELAKDLAAEGAVTFKEMRQLPSLLRAATCQ